MKNKYFKVAITLILSLIVIIVPFIPVNSLITNINLTDHDKININAKDPMELTIIDEYYKIGEFCDENNIKTIPKYISYK